MEKSQADPISAVVAKYKDAGWDAIRTPPGSGTVDIIACKNEQREVKGVMKLVKTKFHFVQVMTDKTQTDAKYQGEARNAFVQNAFSNAADPIFALVVQSRGRNPEPGESKWITKTRVTLRNVNSDSAVRV